MEQHVHNVRSSDYESIYLAFGNEQMAGESGQLWNIMFIMSGLVFISLFTWR